MFYFFGNFSVCSQVNCFEQQLEDENMMHDAGLRRFIISQYQDKFLVF